MKRLSLFLIVLLISCHEDSSLITTNPDCCYISIYDYQEIECTPGTIPFHINTPQSIAIRLIESDSSYWLEGYNTSLIPLRDDFSFGPEEAYGFHEFSVWIEVDSLKIREVDLGINHYRACEYTYVQAFP